MSETQEGYVPCWHILFDGRVVEGVCKQTDSGYYHLILYIDKLPEDMRGDIQPITPDGTRRYIHRFVKADQIRFTLKDAVAAAPFADERK